MKKYLIVIFLLLSCNAWGTTYYCDFGTGADSNAGTQESPWKYAPGMDGWTGSATLSNNDTVVFKGGVTWTWTSTTSNIWTIPNVTNLTIKGGQLLETPWGTGYPVFDGDGSTGTRIAIYNSGRSGLTLDGIKLYRIGRNTGDNADGSGYGIYCGSASSITIKNCWIETYAVNAIAIGTETTNVSAIYIHDNHFKNNGRVTMGTDYASFTGVIDDIQIYNNLFEGPGDPDDGGYNGRYFSLNAGGSGYTAGDTLTVVQDGASGGTVEAKTVDGSGVVTSITGKTRGTGYKTASGLATTGGTGEGCKITQNDYHGDGFMIQASNATTYGITNLKIHHNKFYGDWNYGATAQIYLSGCTMSGSCDASDPDSCSCSLSYTSGALVVGVPYFIRTYNSNDDFTNVGAASNAAGVIFTATGTTPTHWEHESQVVIQGPYSTSNTQIYNNIFAYENTDSRTGNYFVGAAVEIYNGSHNNAVIYGNTIDLDAYSTALPSNCIAVYNTNGVQIKDNIIMGCLNGIVGLGTAKGTVEVDYNIYYNVTTRWMYGWPGSASSDCKGRAVGESGKTACQATPFFQENASVTDGDPKITASPDGTSGSGNWALQSSSPAIGKGVQFNSIFTDDIAGTARGTVWDIGAYEYEAGATTPSHTFGSGGASHSFGAGSTITWQ